MGDDTLEPSVVVEVGSETEFDQLVKREELVLVDFHADWCGPCQLMAPTVGEFAGETDATVVKVDVEAVPGLAQCYDVRSIPTFVGFRRGEEVGRSVGMQDKAELHALVD